MYTICQFLYLHWFWNFLKHFIFRHLQSLFLSQWLKPHFKVFLCEPSCCAILPNGIFYYRLKHYNTLMIEEFLYWLWRHVSVAMGDMFWLLCSHHQAILRHSQGTKVRTLWECAPLYLDCVLVWPDGGCIGTETCCRSQYRNSSIIYVLLCFRR